MTVEELFQQVRKERKELKILQSIRENLITQATRVNKPFSDVRVQTSMENRYEDCMAKLSDVESEIVKLYDELMDNYNEAFYLIRNLEDSTQRTVVELYYIGEERPLKISEIADRLSYSKRQVIRIKENAIAQCERIWMR